MPPAWVALWTASLASARDALAATSNAHTSVLAYMYARLGYDAGCIMRALRADGLSWGTYQDQMTNKANGEWHCNAHSNNLVIVAPGAIDADSPEACRLLSCLDLDMAFDAVTYVDTSTGVVGQEAVAFARLLDFERFQMMSVLSGADASSGVPQNMKQYIQAHTRPTDASV